MAVIVDERGAAAPQDIVKCRSQGEQGKTGVQHAILQMGTDYGQAVAFVVIGAEGGKIHLEALVCGRLPELEILCPEHSAGVH